MTVPTPRDPVRQGRDVLTRLDILESRIGLPARLSGMGYGSTTERDVYFTVPVTDAQKAELANRRPTWFNTDKGYEERYYAVAGTPGLTAPGLASPGAGYGAPATGWYPAPGTLAYMTRIKSNNFQSAPAGGWTLPTLLGAGSSAFAHVGGMFSANSNSIIIPNITGVFDLTASIYWSGGGAMNYTLAAIRYTGGSEINVSRAYASSSDMQQIIAVDAVYCWAGQGIELAGFPAGAHNIFGDGLTRRTFLTMKYAGPPLAV